MGWGDDDHTTTNFTLYPELLQRAGYATHALGKWDVGSALRNATATYRGFDTFYGYYPACTADYWYHTVPNGGNECTIGNVFNWSIQCWGDNVGHQVGPGDSVSRNGTYNRELLSNRAAAIIADNNDTERHCFSIWLFRMSMKVVRDLAR